MRLQTFLYMFVLLAISLLYPLQAQEQEELPYDVIVVGLGASGSALVGHLLKHNAELKILALEAGDSNEDTRIRDPNKSLELWHSHYDWKDQTVPQIHLGNRKLNYSSGKGCGGSTSINGTVWVHGHPDDYDEWEQLGNAGWGSKEMLRILQSIEKHGDRFSSTRGSQGPVSIFSFNSYSPFTIDFVKSMERFGLPFNPDYNSHNKHGVSFIQQNVTQKGERIDAFTAFVAPLRHSKNLTIKTHAMVQEILIEDYKATGVRYTTQDALELKAFARKYVVLSSGTFRSPQILMLSGIGNKHELSKVKIEAKLHLPGVGKNLQEHPVSIVTRGISLPFPVSRTMQNIGFFDEDPTSPLQGSPKYQLQTFLIKKYPPFPDNSFGIGLKLQHPRSRGSVSLNQENIHAPPLIDPNLFASEQDKIEMVAGMKKVQAMLDHLHTSTSWLTDKAFPKIDIKDDKAWWSYLEEHASLGLHPVGTCKMGPSEDAMSVVDHRLNVHKIKNLKVVDASIMPVIPAGNIMATAIAIGLKGGELILEESALSSTLIQPF